MDEALLKAALEEALQAERDGYALYSMAAERAEDPGAQEMFERLAEDEKHHYETLQRQLQAIHEGSGWREEIGLTVPVAPHDVAGIFSQEFRERLKGKHVEASALSIGLLLERNAMAFYSKLAQEAKSPVLEAFFHELADWETAHYQLLLRLDGDLKEDYWAKNRFAPLL